MRIQESLVTDKQIALELYSENGKFRLPIEGKDYYFPSLEKVHEAFLSQDTYDTIKLAHEGKKSYLHLFMDEIEVFDTKKALRQRLSQDSQGMWAEIRNGQKHYYVEERGWISSSYKEITKQECIEKLQHTSTMTKALSIGLGMLALLPGAFEFARHLPISTKEAAMGLIALNQKSPIFGAVGYSLLPSKVEAQALGTEFQVNTYTTSNQQDPSVAPLNDGGFIVTWTSGGSPTVWSTMTIGTGQDGDDSGIFAQRYDSNGVTVGPEFQVNTYTTLDQYSSKVAPLNDGGFVVVWQSDGQDGDTDGVYGQRYDSSGSPAGSEFQINTYTTKSQRYPSIAPLSDGGFVVTWESDGQDGNFYGIFGQRYDSSGMATGTEFQVNTHTTSDQQYPSIAPLNNGGFVVTWESYRQDGDIDGIFGQRYDSNGAAAGTEFQINTYTASNQQYPTVAPLNDGGFVVVWQSLDQDGDSYGIFGQRYDSNGAASGTEFQVNTYTTNAQGKPSIAPLNDGGFVVVWQSSDQDGSRYGIYGQRYDSIGVATGAEFIPHTYIIGQQLNACVAPLNDGGFVITWDSGRYSLLDWLSSSSTPTGQDGDFAGIFGQRYDASGNPIPLQISASTIVLPTPSTTPPSPSQNTPTPSLVTTRSTVSSSMPTPNNPPSPTPAGTTSMVPTTTVASVSPSPTPNSSTAPPSNSPSPTPAGTTSMVPTTTVASATPSPTPNGSTAPSSTPSPTPVTTSSTLGSITVSSTRPTSNPLATDSTQSTLTSSTTASGNTPSLSAAMTGTTPTTSMITSAPPSSNTEASTRTPSSRSVTSTSVAAMPISSTPVIGSVENIVYGESYPLLINDEVVGTYTVSGGTGSLDSGNLSVISFEFDPGFQPEEGDVITLFYLPEEEVALWESIEIEGESFECLTTYGQIVTNDGLSSFQVFFEDTECLAMAPTMLATALPLTLN